MNTPLSSEAEMMLGTLVAHRRHLESHACGRCVSSYETLLKTVMIWLDSQSQKEEEHGEPKKDSNDQSFEEGQGPKGSQTKKEAWDIFD